MGQVNSRTFFAGREWIFLFVTREFGEGRSRHGARGAGGGGSAASERRSWPAFCASLARAKIMTKTRPKRIIMRFYQTPSNGGPKGLCVPFPVTLGPRRMTFKSSGFLIQRLKRRTRSNLMDRVLCFCTSTFIAQHPVGSLLKPVGGDAGRVSNRRSLPVPGWLARG